MSFKRGLRQWRAARSIAKPSGKFFEMIFEELTEYKVAKTQDEKVDAICDIIVLATNELELEGYDLDLAMTEVVNHISARRQCPEQASRDWTGEKWAKDKNQGLILEPDYSKCKI